MSRRPRRGLSGSANTEPASPRRIYLGETHVNHPRQWFGQKRFGIGYGPRTWEGWAIVGIAIVIAMALKKG